MEFKVTNQELLERKILSQAKVVGETGNKVNLNSYITKYNNNVVDVPGNVKLHDVGFFAQGNPFDDKPQIDFSTSFINPSVQEAFPPITYYQNVLVNDANSPLIFDPGEFAKSQQHKTLADIQRQRYLMKQPLKSQLLTDKDVNIII